MNITQAIYDRHDIHCNQKYGGDKVPYSFHLDNVRTYAVKFKDLLRQYDPLYARYVELAAAGHDLIEDARMSFNEVRDLVGEIAAEAIYACTELRGHNRDERKSKEFYEYLAQNPLAVYVKLCDIISNVSYSIHTQSSMAKKYTREYPKVKEYLSAYHDTYKPMFDYLDTLMLLIEK